MYSKANLNLLICLLCIQLMGCAGNAKLSSDELTQSKFPVAVILNADRTEPCVAVTIKAKVHVTGPKAGQLFMEILNQLDEDVFIEVTDLVKVPLLMIRRDGSGLSGYSSEARFPDCSKRYQLLGAAGHKNEEYPATICAYVFHHGLLSTEGVTLSDWVGEKVTASITVHGITRETNQEFRETLEVPIEIVMPTAK